MNTQLLVELRQATPLTGAAPLTVSIEHGMSCLMASDEPLANRYLRLMAGVEASVQGGVTLLGEQPRGDLYREQQLRRRVGYVAPQAPLLSVLDGVRNVMLPVLYHGIASEKEAAALAGTLIEEMAYDGDARQLPAFMPELQRRMLLIARALILKPELLFIEQPLRGLDSASCDRLCDYLCGAVAQRVAALVIASNAPMLASVAQQVIFIGRQRATVFAGWQELVTADESEITEFLERERRFCSVLQG